MKSATLSIFTVTLSVLCLQSCIKETNQPVSSASSESLETYAHYIGEHFGGGIIFYIDTIHKHGIIAAEADIEEPAVWAYEDTLTRAKGTAIGYGGKNTSRILRVQGDPIDQAEDYAALECAEFELNGYSDWYLPSKDELNELYKQKNIVGGFRTIAYWSSSEFNLTAAWFQNFSNGSQVKAGKKGSYALRPVRYF